MFNRFLSNTVTGSIFTIVIYCILSFLFLNFDYREWTWSGLIFLKICLLLIVARILFETFGNGKQ